MTPELKQSGHPVSGAAEKLKASENLISDQMHFEHHRRWTRYDIHARNGKEVRQRLEGKDIGVEEDDLGEGCQSEDVEFGEDGMQIRSTYRDQ